MKRGAKGCWRASFARLVSLIFAVWFVGAFASTESAAQTSVHFTRGDVLVQEEEGYSLPSERVDGSTLAGEWLSASLPHAPSTSFMARPKMVDDGHPYTVVHWYRLRTEGLDRIPAPRYLYIPRWKTDGTIAIYGDGHLLYQSHANLQWNGSNLPLWIGLDDIAGVKHPPREILIRMQHLPGIGGALSTVWAGSSEDLYWRYLTRMVFQAYLPFFSSAAFLALGVFAFGVWAFRRGDTLYLLFFAMSAAAYIRTMHSYLGMDRLPITDEWFGWLTVSSMFWLTLTGHLFLEKLHGRPNPWATRAFVAATLVETVVTLPLTPHFLDATLAAPWLYVTLIPITLGIAGINIRSGLQAGSNHAVLLSSMYLLSLLLGVYDWLLQNNYVSIESLFPGTYAGVGIFYLFSYVMFRRYVDALHEVERVNAGLAQRLKEREAELLESHRRLREAEQKEVLRQERQRLMQDMHDGLGSSLVSALRVVEHGRVGDVDIAQVLKDCIDDLKLTIDSMEPVEADLLLLLATLRFRLAPRLEGAGVNLRWAVQDVPALPWLTPRHSLHILRILQESFANALKHAKATEICVTTRCEAGGVMVTVADNGVGFDPSTLTGRRGRGLENQRRRAESIGGKVEWTPSDSGTVFSLWLPLRAERASGAPPTAGHGETV